MWGTVKTMSIGKSSTVQDANANANGSLQHDRRFFCPPGSGKLCALTQVCLNGKCSTDPDQWVHDVLNAFVCLYLTRPCYGRQTFIWILVCTILSLVVINSVMGFKVYRRWHSKQQEQEELEQYSVQSGRSLSEEKPISQPDSRHLEAICINNAVTSSGSSIAGGSKTSANWTTNVGCTSTID